MNVTDEEHRLIKEKVRVYQLARDLNVDSKVLLDLCKQAGFDVKNQLSNLEPEQRDALEVMMKKGAQAPPKPVVPAKPVTPVLSPDHKAVPVLARPRVERAPRPSEGAPAPEPAPALTPPPARSPPEPRPVSAPVRSGDATGPAPPYDLARESASPA